MSGYILKNFNNKYQSIVKYQDGEDTSQEYNSEKEARTAHVSSIKSLNGLTISEEEIDLYEVRAVMKYETVKVSSGKLNLTWKDVLLWNNPGTLKSEAVKAASDCGYKYFLFNDRVYKVQNVFDFKGAQPGYVDTNLTIKDVK